MLDILGVISILIFYLLILIVGIWAGRKGPKDGSEEEVMLAGRNIGMFVGICTMTATWVGGGYINGTAEAIYTSGLIWCQAPFGYALSLVVGGQLFANTMRKQGYVTMLDPLQDAFGELMGGLLFLPTLCGEVFWAANNLAVFGRTMVEVIDMDFDTSIMLSASIAVSYTLYGGFYSVAYTDVVKLFCIFIGLWLCVPFALTHDAAGSLTKSLQNVEWISKVGSGDWGIWIEEILMRVFAGVLWQSYFQRVLSCQTPARAQLSSFVAAFGCIIMALPPLLIGVIARVSDESETKYGNLHKMNPELQEELHTTLLLLMKHFTPNFVWLFGLGAVSVANLSSVDSRVLSASSLFARNFYKRILRRYSSEEMVWVMGISIFVVGALATVTALTIPEHTFGLWAMGSDLVYVIIFPQLLMVTRFPNYCNTYGSLAAYVIALVVRLGGGVHFLGLKSFIHFPYYKPEDEEYWELQRFPFKTMTMLISLVTLVAVSNLADWLFDSGFVNPKYRCGRRTVQNSTEPSQVHESVIDDPLIELTNVENYSVNTTEEGKL